MRPLLRSTALPALLLAGAALIGGCKPSAREVKTEAGGAGAGRQTEQAPERSQVAMAHPTGSRATSLLLVEASAPKQSRVGESATYTVKLTNLTSELTLADVRVRLHTSEDIDVRQAPAGQDKDKDKDKKGGGKGAAGPGQEQGADGHAHVARLAPGQSETIEIHAVGRRMGELSACLGVEYTPLLCLKTDFVKAELELARNAPETADLCDPIEVRYEVKNSGNAPATGVRIREDLPRGLTTADGKQAVALDVGELAPGQSQQASVKLHASRPGSYPSQGALLVGDREVARSTQTTTVVQQALLQAEIDGPDAEYVNRPASFLVTVRNDGDAPAQSARLEVQVNGPARALRREKEKPLDWDLGTIKPGETRRVRFSLVGQKKGDVKVSATARAECAREVEGAVAQASAPLELLVLPALRLSLIDKPDPIRVGDEVSYTIQVINQGSGPDSNLRLTAKLPEQLAFVSASGASEAQAKGQDVTFGALKSLGAGDKAEWVLKARATKSGDVRVTVQLQSEYLASPLPTVEPTRLLPK